MGNQLKNVAAIACMKSLLMLFNIAFWFSGMIILATGLWAEVDLHNYFDNSFEFSETIPFVSIGIGCLTVFISSLACTCTVKGQPVLLYLYGGFLAVIFVLELGVEISLYAYKHRLLEALDRAINVTFTGNTATNVDVYYKRQIDFDTVQTYLHCCGVHNYTDWLQVVPARPVPLTCCKSLNNCIPSNPADIYVQGCYSILVSFFEKNCDWVLGIAAVVATFPLIGAVISCCLANQIKKAKYDIMT